MQVDGIKPTGKTGSFSGVLNNRVLIKGLEMASDNGALFAAAASLALTTVIRPISIMATPNVEKENKQYACAKSIASGIVNFGLMFLITTPIVSAVKNIQNNPKKFLNAKTINALSDSAKPLQKSAKFNFINQFLKLGSGLLTVVPKTFLTCALIPPTMALVFNKNKVEEKTSNKNISFKGMIKTTLYDRFTNKISSSLSHIFNSDKVQKFSQKYSDTNLAQHMFSASDVLATGLFMHYTSKNKDIEPNRKKTLIYNAGIATGITVIGGYIVNSLIKKPTEIFIQKFKNANKNLKQLDRCVEGIHTAKAALILGGMYYIVTPILATLLAEKMTNNSRKS